MSLSEPGATTVFAKWDIFGIEQKVFENTARLQSAGHFFALPFAEAEFDIFLKILL